MIKKYSKQLSIAVIINVILLSSLSLNAATSSDSRAIQTTPSQQKATKEILNILAKKHFVDVSIDDELSVRFLNNYIKRLDPNKSFFIQSDIDEFNQYRYDLDNELLNGKNSIGFNIYQRFKERMDHRLQKLIDQLSNDTSTIDFTIDESIPIDAEEMHWPTSLKDADEQWRKRIKSYFLTQKLANEEVTKSREQLLKRYKNQLDRLSKNKSEDVYEIYINAFTELYDPHTNYFSPRTSENFSINMSLSLEGIGAVLQTEDEYTKVVRLVTAGPAYKQGELKPADRITAVGQDDKEMIDVIGWRLDEVVDLIRGPKDSIVRLEITSPSAAEFSKKIISIKRDKVKLEDQAAQKAIITHNDKGKNYKIGVIDIPTFYLDFEALRNRDPNYRSTTKDVARLLSELEVENVDGIIIDLRNNGGGSLYEATAVTDLFIDKGPVVQIGKDGARKSNNYSQNNARYRGPLLVLINRLSASASEIFSGAIQDYNRGLIVGSQSFGKGTVQTLTPLKSQGELKITESKFYRVSGESTQHRGVIPDISMPELIDASEVGESNYETALSWSKTEAVRHGEYFSLEKLIPILSTDHEERIENNPDFIYIEDRKALIDRNINNKFLSLNEAQRRKEKFEFENESLRIENKRRKSKKLSSFANYNELTEHIKKENDARLANSGTNVINTKDDALLEEASYILKDFIQLLSTENSNIAKSH